jgi:hypothetical protein
MCSLEFFKRIVPFAITFGLGIFIAGAFYSLTSPHKSKSSHSPNAVKTYKHNKTKCNYDKMRFEENIDINIEEDVILIDIDENMIAPQFRNSRVEPLKQIETIETTVFPPTPPETIILVEELRKKNK